MSAPPIWFGTNESPPEKGNVLVLNHHHDGESHWCSPEQAIQRIEFNLDGGKPEEEWGTRMEAMRIVPYGTWWDDCAAAYLKYKKARNPAMAECKQVIDAAYAEFLAARDAAAYAEFRTARDAAADADYKKARDAAYAEFRKVCNAAWADLWAAMLDAGAVPIPAEEWAAAWKEANP